MNYLKEINAFYDQCETNSLSGAAILLWHSLMQVNNRARWKKKFTAPMGLLCHKSRLSASSFKRARKELSEKGYIHYESQRGNQSAIYEIVSLEFYTEEGACQIDTDEDSLPSKETESLNDNLDHKINRDPGPLYKHKQNKTKQKNTYIVDGRQREALQFYQNNFGKVNGYIQEELTKQIHELGEDLVLHAMKKTLDRGKTNWGYAKAILNTWRSKGISTIEEADLEEVKYKQTRKQRERSRQSPNPQYMHREPVPDWFYKHKQEQKEKHEQERKKQQDKDPQQMVEEVKRRLLEYAD